MITVNMLNNFRDDFKKSVKELEEKYGISISVYKIDYLDNGFDMKVGVIENTEASKNLSVEELLYLQNCQSYGLSKDLLNRTFTDEKGHERKLLGMIAKVSSRTKKPFLSEDIKTKKQFVSTAEYIKGLNFL